MKKGILENDIRDRFEWLFGKISDLKLPVKINSFDIGLQRYLTDNISTYEEFRSLMIKNNL